MTTKAENERLTQIGPDTPMGHLLRRYWQVVGTESELAKEPVQKVRLLGEDLTLFRTEKGRIRPRSTTDARIAACRSNTAFPRIAACAAPITAGLFDPKGNCVEMPFEDFAHPELRYKEKIKIKAYPCEALGGFVWAYMGPAPVPLLPRWDLLVRDDLDRAIEIYHAAVQLGTVHGQLGRSRAFRIPAREVRQLSGKESAAVRRQ